MISYEIHGLDELVSKLNKLPDVLKNSVADSQELLIEKAEGYAQRELQSSVKYSSGELARSFRHEIKMSDNSVIGRWWNVDPVAIYREFGTGRNGEMSPKNLPENVTISYRQTPWFIPADKVDVDLNELYRMPKIKINGKTYYRTNGQIARRFVTPSIEKVAQEAPDIFKNNLNERFRELSD